MRVAAVRRGLAALGALAAWACMAAAPAPSDGLPPHAIGAPHYGDTLFHFYQDHTFTALTGLMVSQQLGRVAPHDEEAEVLRGGMLLAYGLHREAGAVFARLIERQASVSVRNRAWYYLASMQHRRNLPGDAEASLARITAPLPGTLEPERQLLAASLRLERGDAADAAALLQPLQELDTPTGAYARFNLGVALIRTGSADAVARGTALLDALGQAGAPDEAMRSLRDRANVALGFADLQAQRPAQARQHLQRVRLNGPESNKALLGLGWAAADAGDPQRALVPWRELASRPDHDAAVLEARIAVPYALAEAGAPARALQAYRQAADDFEQEQGALAASIAGVRDGRFVQGLLRVNATEGLGAFPGINAWPEMPHASHLLALVASHDFQEGFRNLRDLQFLDTNLRGWQDSLSTFQDMLDNRRRAFAERLPTVRAAAGANDLEGLQRQRDTLVATLARADPGLAASEAGDGAAALLADPRERALQERLDRSRGTLARADAQALPADEASAIAERLRRAAGALEWQRTQALPARHWEATKALREIDQELAQSRERDAALRRVEATEPARHEAYSRRIAELAQRIEALRPVVTTLAAAQRDALQAVAVAELQQQQEQLNVYAGQARLAIAQIHDLAQAGAKPMPEVSRKPNDKADGAGADAVEVGRP